MKIENNLIKPHDHILLALSGGVDSVCLLYLLKDLQNSLLFVMSAFHLNHNLRGAEADKDEAFVIELCKKLDIPIYTYSKDINTMALNQKKSIEEAAREARYNLLNKCMLDIGANKIATAHHKNDNVETILLNLFRGTGLKGLTGIQPKRGNIIRPLINITKSEIENYCDRHNITYRVDKTNYESDYTRNKIRNLIIPYIEKEMGHSITNPIANVSKILTLDENYLDRTVNELYKKIVISTDSEIKININNFKTLDGAIKQRLIRKILEKYTGSLKGFTQTHIIAITELGSNKKLNLPNSVVVSIVYNDMILSRPKSLKSYEYELKKGDFLYIKEEGFYISLNDIKIYKEDYINTCTKTINCDKIKGRLVVRTKQVGDEIVIKNVGTQKLKKYFINNKIPSSERDMPLVADNSDIVWIINRYVSHKYSQNKGNKWYLQIWEKEEA